MLIKIGLRYIAAPNTDGIVSIRTYASLGRDELRMLYAH